MATLADGRTWRSPSPAPRLGIVTAVDVRGLCVRYGDVEALRGMDLQAPRGAITAFLGRNGAGKTTAMETCVGLRRADSGHVRVLGMDPTSHAPDLHPRVGVMLQDGGIPTMARPRSFLTALGKLYRDPRDAGELLEWLGLIDVNRPYRRLSGGEQQRVKLAAALMGRPELVFLDEPSTGLDPVGRNAMWELLDSLRRDGVTVVLTTHAMAEAEALADHVVIVDHGQTVASGSLESLVGTSGDVLTFSGPLHLDLRTLGDVLPDGTAAIESSPGDYRIAGSVSPQVIASVTAWCAQHGVTPRHLRVGQRSLEDVFMELTGSGRES